MMAQKIDVGGLRQKNGNSRKNGSFDIKA